MADRRRLLGRGEARRRMETVLSSGCGRKRRQEEGHPDRSGAGEHRRQPRERFDNPADEETGR